jgi:hypothetical protein
MQDEIKRYKQEIKKQQIAEIQQKDQLKIKEQLEHEKKQIEADMKNSKMQMRNFKLNKFLVLLNSLVVRSGRNNKHFGFN